MYILIVIAGLAISGITAFALESELYWLTLHDGWLPLAFQTWFHTIYAAVNVTNARFPWLSYGTDWLAFAHLMLALLFLGPLTDPVKNIWVIQFGIICCALILPLALIAGQIRTIPFFWRLVDCSFGVIGIVPLLISFRLAEGMGKAESPQNQMV